MDLKPSSILAKFVPGGSLFDIKVGDLGSCVPADPRARQKMDAEALRTKGIQMQTLGFRAPEVLFGDEAYGPAADSVQ